MSVSLVLVGGGKMGAAMLAGWLERDIPATAVTIVEPDPGIAAALRDRHAVVVREDPSAIPEAASPDVVVFAVKPQVMDAAVPGYRRFVRPQTVFLSIAAGRTIASFERILGTAAVVRAMPNTPAAVGRGITVACANPLVVEGQRQMCNELLGAVGDVSWVDDEGLLDPVTAVSGSGPAYVFLLTECLAEAGIAAGLPAALSEQLARATVAGAGELLLRTEESAATLRQNVTSPGGTTAAALEVLASPDGMRQLMTAAVDRAARRSRELAN